MSFNDDYMKLRRKRLGEADERLKEENIAPVLPATTTVASNKDDDDDVWFKAGAFDDGYQFGDVLSSLFSTVGDVGVNVVKGVGNMAEGVTDLLLYGASGLSDLVGADSFADDLNKLAREESVNDALSGIEGFVDENSFFGDKMDSVSQGLGQVGGDGGEVRR